MQIDPEPIPNGTGGAGEQWVRKRYAALVKKYRMRATRAKTALIIAIDADTYEIDRRARQLDEELEGVTRKAVEAIVHLIPKRNIETWILHLNGEQVDESTDHSNRDVDHMIQPAAVTFYEWTSKTPDHCLPSLRAGIGEARRLG